jgi:hypothetical protein
MAQLVSAGCVFQWANILSTLDEPQVTFISVLVHGVFEYTGPSIW